VAIVVFFVVWVLGGLAHARRRIRQGRPLLAYHKWMWNMTHRSPASHYNHSQPVIRPGQNTYRMQDWSQEAPPPPGMHCLQGRFSARRPSPSPLASIINTTKPQRTTSKMCLPLTSHLRPTNPNITTCTSTLSAENRSRPRSRANPLYPDHNQQQQLQSLLADGTDIRLVHNALMTKE